MFSAHFLKNQKFKIEKMKLFTLSKLKKLTYNSVNKTKRLNKQFNCIVEYAIN